MKLLKNGYSDKAVPGRGYHDSELIIEFEGENDQQREGAKKALMALHASDMWCHVVAFTEQQLHLRHGYDSGD